MSRTTFLDVPADVAGTRLKPVVSLVPVAAPPGTGGAEVHERGGAGLRGVVKKAAVAAAVGHVVTAGATVKDALGTPDLVWDTAGISRTRTIAQIALLPGIGAQRYRAEAKPKLAVAEQAVEHLGG